jgi:hypothetical protein
MNHSTGQITIKNNDCEITINNQGDIYYKNQLVHKLGVKLKKQVITFYPQIPRDFIFNNSKLISNDLRKMDSFQQIPMAKSIDFDQRVKGIKIIGQEENGFIVTIYIPKDHSSLYYDTEKKVHLIRTDDGEMVKVQKSSFQPDFCFSSTWKK